MFGAGTATLQDGMGVPFLFQTRPIGWISEGRDAVYAFASQRRDGAWIPHYIGRAVDLAARLADHERLDEAIHSGATHLLFHLARPGDPLNQTEVEARLIRHHDPVMNVQTEARGREVVAILRARRARREAAWGQVAQ
ncbi:MAG: hypothetical protein AAF919_11175 [Pseudomonadota bacterium]